LKPQLRSPGQCHGRGSRLFSARFAVNVAGTGIRLGITAARSGATTAHRVRGRWQLCRSSFRYPAVSVRETGIWQAPRVLGRPDLKGLLRNDCGRQRRSLTSTPMSPVVSVEHIDASSRQERTHDQERLSCGVTIAGSALRGRDLGIRQWFMAPSRAVCPRKVTQRRGSWSAPSRSACTGWVGPGAVRPLQGRGQVRSALGCQRL
jgi:hypothetical protein